MSPATLAARLLRRGASSCSSSPLRALTRRALNSSSGPAPLPRCLPAATTSPASHWTATRRFLASSQSPASSSSSSSKEASADERLRRVIDSEIECIEQSESTANKVIDLPDDFPFEIIDNPGDHSITLKREFAGETIKCDVYTDSVENFNEDDEDENDDDDSFKPPIQMVVRVQKSEGPILEFECNFNDDELTIENFRMLNRDSNNPDDENMYKGPPFSVLDESLRKSLHRYLEVRGVKHSLHDWLYEYMMHKDDKEYVTWLKNMKEFMGN